MSLPTLNHPVQYIKIPSLNKEFKFRPWLVKENKILLESKHYKKAYQQFEVYQNMISNCIQDDSVDVQSLPNTDISYIMLQLRKISKGETIELIQTCPKCQTKLDFIVNINDIKFKGDATKTTKDIKLDDKYTIRVKQPSIETIKAMDKYETEEDISYYMVLSSLDKLFEEDAVYSFSTYTKEEVENFYGNLSITQQEMITDFILETATLEYQYELTCTNADCKHVIKDKITEFGDFFI